MDVFGKGTDEPSRPLLPPGTCWICENSPQQEGMKVIDTRRNARAGGTMSHDSVRKYVCEPCARECGEAVGMVTPEEAAEIKQELGDAKWELISLSERLEAAEAGQVKVVSADALFAKLNEWKNAPSNTASASFTEQLQTEVAALKAEAAAEKANPRSTYGDNVPPSTE